MASLTSRGRIEWVDVAKAISILLVVLLHVVIELDFIGIESRWVNDALPVMSTMRMPLFFTASGLFAVGWITRRSWTELFNHKVGLLLWVFLIWQPVVLAYKIAEMWWLPNQPESSLGIQVGKVALSPLRPNGELWFLWALALFFMLARVTRKLPNIVRVGVPLAISVGWSSASEGLVTEDQLRFLGNGVNGALSYYVFFVCAVVYAGHIKRLFSCVRPVVGVGLLVGWILVNTAVEMLNVDFPGLLFVLRIFAVAAGFALATLLVWVRPLVWLGANTLQVYVAHIVFVVAITLGVYHVGLADVLARFPELSIAALMVAASLLSIGLHMVAVRVPFGRFLYEQPRWLRLGQPMLRTGRSTSSSVRPSTD